MVPAQVKPGPVSVFLGGSHHVDKSASLHETVALQSGWCVDFAVYSIAPVRKSFRHFSR